MLETFLSKLISCVISISLFVYAVSEKKHHVIKKSCKTIPHIELFRTDLLNYSKMLGICLPSIYLIEIATRTLKLEDWNDYFFKCFF